MWRLGIDIGGTYIKYAFIDDSYHLVKKWRRETPKCSFKEEFYDDLCREIDVSEIAYVGVSAPGIIDRASNVLSKASEKIRIMFQTNVNKEISARLGRPVTTLNDAKAAGLCELKLGNGRGTQSSVYWIIGTGIGGCVCDSNTVWEGKDRLAGEFSFLPVILQGNERSNMGKLASMKALIEQYNQQSTGDRRVRFGKEVCERYLQGDPIAVKVMDLWCQNMVWGLYSVMLFYNPDVICIGGGISQEDWFLQKIRETFQRETKLHLKELITTRIERCRFHNDANLLGAVLYAETCLEGEEHFHRET